MNNDFIRNALINREISFCREGAREPEMESLNTTADTIEKARQDIEVIVCLSPYNSNLVEVNLMIGEARLHSSNTTISEFKSDIYSAILSQSKF